MRAVNYISLQLIHKKWVRVNRVEYFWFNWRALISLRFYICFLLIITITWFLIYKLNFLIRFSLLVKNSNKLVEKLVRNIVLFFLLSKLIGKCCFERVCGLLVLMNWVLIIFRYLWYIYWFLARILFCLAIVISYPCPTWSRINHQFNGLAPGTNLNWCFKKVIQGRIWFQ